MLIFRSEVQILLSSFQIKGNMLTVSQKISLQQLMDNCPNSKLKIVLNKVIPKWILGEVKPVKYSMG